MTAPQIIRIGLIGCGEVTQVIHLPTLLHMNHLFKITYLCDVSPNALTHCAAKIPGSLKTTSSYEELCASTEVDAVIVATSDEYHADQTIAALKNGKNVLVEKPLALNIADCERIKAAEGGSRGRVMVGYMRRYAAPFEDVVKEVGGMDKILYARVRDIIGPNSTFVSQSATFPQKFTDFKAEDIEDKKKRGEEQVTKALEENGVAFTDERMSTWRVLCGLGSHDLSAMRDIIGMPKSIIGSSMTLPFLSAIMNYETFTLTYETGFHNIPLFDAHIEVYSKEKSVRIQYDTPYVKGLPVTMHISERDGEALKETTVRKSFEDPYTREMKVFWEMIVEGKMPKTTVVDAMEDLEIFGMLMKKAYASV